MSLFARVKRKLFPVQQHDATAVFKVLYGCEPSPEQAGLLQPLCGITDPALLYRAVLNRFDRQALNTAFAVRMTAADIQHVQYEGHPLAIDTADVSVSHCFQMGEAYEPHIVKFLKAQVKPGMTVVDVGANIGAHTLLAATLVGTTGCVYSLEPNSENCRLILLTLEKNQLQQVRLLPVAASAEAGFTLFTTHLGSNGGLLPRTQQALTSPSCMVVPTVRLDDVITGHVDVIKLDTEGAEGLVIDGAKRIMAQHRPVVVSEFSPEMLARVSGRSAAAYLQSYVDMGYELFVLTRPTGDLQPIHSIAAFLATYGEDTRIEDIAFVPKTQQQA
jgi:FkbM family methyltransferase